MDSDIFYSLCIEDIQTVAREELGRNLSKTETNSLLATIAKKINWYDAIADSINEHVETD